MTHFGIIVGALATTLGLLSMILGFIVKGVAAWVKLGERVKGVEVRLGQMSDKLVDVLTSKLTDHDEMKARIRELEIERAKKR